MNASGCESNERGPDVASNGSNSEVLVCVSDVMVTETQDQATSSSTTTTTTKEVSGIQLHNEDARLQQESTSDDKVVSSKVSRKVSFPQDAELVTGYLEPVNPWAEVIPVTNEDLRELYVESCVRHATEPKEVILKHLDEFNLAAEPRTAVLDLTSHSLTHADCEALEEIFKRLQYKSITLRACGLDDISATAIFDMVEYYEATSELDISENADIKNRGWQSCINMLKRSQELKILSAQGTPISEMNASSLGKALGWNGSVLHTLKLDHCGMTGRPIASLCTALRKTTVLKELWLADNDLNSFDAYNIAMLLKTNLYIQFLHLSNNIIKDEGMSFLSEAIIEQTKLIKEPLSERTARMDYSELSASLNYLNNNKCLSPSFKRPDKAPFDEVEKAAVAAAALEKTKIHLLGQSMNNNDEHSKAVVTQEHANNKEDEPPKLPTGEENANEISSPLNAKSLKEELEGVCDEAARVTSQPIDIPTINKPVAEPVVAKSLDTDSEFEDKTALPGRSFSSESLNSLTSIDSNDSKSSIRITEAKFAKNGTLERQQSGTTLALEEPPTLVATGLQELILWNNRLTKVAAKPIADMIAQTTTLEVLNIGRNHVGNDFVSCIKGSLKTNMSLVTLGLQGTHLSCPAVTALADVLKGNMTLRRLDLRDNNIQMEGLEALKDALPSNMSIMQIDLDDVPRRLSESTDSTAFHHLISTIKAHCDRNANPQPVPAPTIAVVEAATAPIDVRTTASPTPHPMIRTTTNSLKRASRKISLTCQNVPPRNVVITQSSSSSSLPCSSSAPSTLPSHLSSVTTIKTPPAVHPASVLSTSLSMSMSNVKKSSKSSSSSSNSSNKRSNVDNKHRLKSPLPSPIVSPLPSPSRNRFQVVKVAENNSAAAGLSPLSAGSLSSGSSPTFFPHPASSRFSVTRVVLPPTSTSTIKATTSTLSLTTTIPLSDSALSSSVESPDMEVKRYMNDSCSSLDSNNDLNVSMSSTDSFDFVYRDIPGPVRIASALPTLGGDETATTTTATKFCDSLSSLEVSASSQESLAVEDTTASGESPKISSNEGTLTNSPCDKETGASTPVRGGSTTATAPRSRKNSWIPNPISMTKSDSGSSYPATLDKLISLFHNPTAIFQRSSPDTTKEVVAVRKESPMGGLFAWATGKKEDESRILNPTNQSPASEATEVPVDENISPQMKQEVKENISPENTVTVNSIKQQQHAVPAPAPVLEKVIFELGDDADDSDRELSLHGSVTAAMQQAADTLHTTPVPSSRFSVETVPD